MERFFSLRRNRAALRKLWRGLRRNRAGSVAAEFGIILPIMLLMYYGVVEIGQAVMADRRVKQLNRALADLTAQVKTGTMPDSEVATIFAIGKMIMAPYTTTPGMMIASVVIDDKGISQVCWSEQSNAAAPPKEVTLPSGLRIPKSSVIMAEASYDYKPLLGETIIQNGFTLGGQKLYARPRDTKPAGAQSIEQIVRVRSAKTIACP